MRPLAPRVRTPDQRRTGPEPENQQPFRRCGQASGEKARSRQTACGCGNMALVEPILNGIAQRRGWQQPGQPSSAERSWRSLICNPCTEAGAEDCVSDQEAVVEREVRVESPDAVLPPTIEHPAKRVFGESELEPNNVRRQRTQPIPHRDKKRCRYQQGNRGHCEQETHTAIPKPLAAPLPGDRHRKTARCGPPCALILPHAIPGVGEPSNRMASCFEGASMFDFMDRWRMATAMAEAVQRLCTRFHVFGEIVQNRLPSLPLLLHGIFTFGIERDANGDAV
jgi:hypothetical protein